MMVAVAVVALISSGAIEARRSQERMRRRVADHHRKCTEQHIHHYLNGLTYRRLQADIMASARLAEAMASWAGKPDAEWKHVSQLHRERAARCGRWVDYEDDLAEKYVRAIDWPWATIVPDKPPPAEIGQPPKLVRGNDPFDF
jgi:hypothetical protein